MGFGLGFRTIELPMIENLKIILLCVAAAIAFGVAHDQITARVCLKYFTVFHAPVFATQSPTVLAFGWWG
jgi:hypothetical protein